MTNKIIGVALLAMTLTLAGGTMGQTTSNPAKKQVQEGPPVTIPLSTGTAINASLVGSLDSEQSAALFVEFDRAILKNGQSAELNAGIQALAPVGAQPTIPSREKYEESRMHGTSRMNSGLETPENPGNVVVPSTYTMPRRTEVMPNLPTTPGIEGGLDRRGFFTPDSKGAFSDPSLRVFTPVSEGSHGTVIVGAKQNVHLENGTHLLIVVQPPAPSSDVR